VLRGGGHNLGRLLGRRGVGHLGDLLGSGIDDQLANRITDGR
jgi:hypothetical protein